MRRVFVSGAVIAAGLAFWVGSAAAHTEFEPATAAPGSIIELTLFVEDEQADAGTAKVELQFPEPITVVDLPAVPGWTATVVGGELGGPATGVTWEGGPEPGDVELPITLGPLPDEPGRLQFKSIQTYDNGEEEAWVADWPEGAPEPANPGPVLDLVAGGPGSVPETTAEPATTTTIAPTTTAPTTTAPTTTAAEQAAAEDGEDDSDSNTLPIVIAALVVLAGAGGAIAFLRNRRSADTEGGSNA